MPTLLTLVALTLSVQASKSSRVAVTIGIDDASRSSQVGISTSLRGCESDAVEFSKLLDTYYAYRVFRLPGREASLDGIRKAVSKGVQALAPNGEFVFYFSGRGSVDEKGMPTLVTTESVLRDAKRDYALAELKKTIVALEGRGVRTTVVLDASFGESDAIPRGDKRSYLNEPRHLKRAGVVPHADWAFQSGGVYIAPVQSQGGAFEEVWNQTDLLNRGVFTNLFVDAVQTSLIEGGAPDAAEISQSVRDDMEAEEYTGRFLNTDVYWEAPAARKVLFGGPSAERLRKEAKSLEQWRTQRAARKTALRIAVDLDPKVKRDDRSREWEALVPPLAQALKRLDPKRIAIMAPSEGTSNLVVYVRRESNRVLLRLLGDDAVETERIVGQGADLESALTPDLQAFIQAKALEWGLYAHFKYGVGNLSGEWQAAPNQKEKIAWAGENEEDLEPANVWEATVRLPEPAWIFVFEMGGDAVRTANLLMPSNADFDPELPKGTNYIPRRNAKTFVFKDGGVTRGLIVRIRPVTGIKLEPPRGYHEAGRELLSTGDYARHELQVLAPVLAALEKGELAWAAKPYVYRVQGAKKTP